MIQQVKYLLTILILLLVSSCGVPDEDTIPYEIILVHQTSAPGLRQILWIGGNNEPPLFGDYRAILQMGDSTPQSNDEAIVNFSISSEFKFNFACTDTGGIRECICDQFEYGESADGSFAFSETNYEFTLNMTYTSIPSDSIFACFRYNVPTATTVLLRIEDR